MVNKVIGYINNSRDPWDLIKIGIDKNRANIIKRNITKKGLVLDFGCGFGFYSKFLKNIGNEVVSMDISKKMIKEGKKLNSELNFCLNDNYNIPLKSNTLDAVLCMGTLMYVDDKQKILKDFYRILKSDGILCVIDRNKLSLFNYVLSKFIRSEKSVDNIKHFLTVNKIKGLLKNNFYIEKTEGDRIELPLLSKIYPINKLLIALGRRFSSISYFIIVKAKPRKYMANQIG